MAYQCSLNEVEPVSVRTLRGRRAVYARAIAREKQQSRREEPLEVHPNAKQGSTVLLDVGVILGLLGYLNIAGLRLYVEPNVGADLLGKHLEQSAVPNAEHQEGTKNGRGQSRRRTQ